MSKVMIESDTDVDVIVPMRRQASSRLKGMRIRDEFLCPITHDLLREPVVANDGHTYEKSAIEKWLRTKNLSPMTNEEMRERTLIMNINLKKLIKDLIDEGGKGLYTTDITNQSRLFDVTPEKILFLKCLGPPESDWNLQTFQISPLGCFGGRKLSDITPGKDVMLFRDTTVSRKHFEVTCSGGHNYTIRDLGSAGGTFIRIGVNQRKELHPGMILLMGKHQFLVSSVDDGTLGNGNNSNNKSINNNMNNSLDNGTNSESSSFGHGHPPAPATSHLPPSSIEQAREQAVYALMGDAEQLLQVLEERENDHTGIDQRMRDLHQRVSALVLQESEEQRRARQIDSKESPVENIIPQFHGTNGVSGNIVRSEPKDQFSMETGKIGLVLNNNQFGTYGGEHGERILRREDTMLVKTVESRDCRDFPVRRRSSAMRDTRKCTLTCFTPDGSPLQGVSFIVGPQGGTIGRKPTNSIPLCIIRHADGSEAGGENGHLDPMVSPTGGQGVRITHIDSAVSGEHARIEMDNQTGMFYLIDGAAGRSSTNGTWYRLSGPYQESPPHELHGGMEVLIGTIRFQVTESMTIAEHAVMA